MQQVPVAGEFGGGDGVGPGEDLFHPIRDQHTFFGGVAMVIVPAGAADHDVIKVNRPFAGAGVFDEHAGKFWRNDGADLFGFGLRQQWFSGGATFREAEAEFSDDLVHGLFGHETIRGEFAAGDVPPARFGIFDLVIAGNVGRFAVWIGNERTQAGPRADDIALGEFRLREKMIHDEEDITDVVGVGENLVERALVIGVSGAEDGTVAPGNGEKDALAFGHDDGVGDGNAIAFDDEVDAFGETEFDVAVRQSVGPWAGGVDDGTGADVERRAGQLVDELAIPFRPVEGGVLEFEIIQDLRAVFGGGAERIEDKAGVVGEAVKITNGAIEVLRLQTGNAFERGGGVQPGGNAEIFAAAKQVVNLDADFELPKFPLAVVAIGRKNEWQRVGEVRSDLMEDFFLDAGFADETKPALGEIPDAAMKQSAGTAAGAEGEIVLLRKADAQAAHGGVAGDAGPDDAATNDKKVKRRSAKGLEGGVPLCAGRQ